MKVPRLRAAEPLQPAAVADVVIGQGEDACAETLPADLRRLSTDAIPKPDVGRREGGRSSSYKRTRKRKAQGPGSLGSCRLWHRCKAE